MSTAPLPDETRRQARTRALEVLDAAPEPLFESVTRAAALVAGKSVALADLRADRLPADLNPEQKAILLELGKVADLAVEQRSIALERNAALAREIATERDLRRGAQECRPQQVAGVVRELVHARRDDSSQTT